MESKYTKLLKKEIAEATGKDEIEEVIETFEMKIVELKQELEEAVKPQMQLAMKNEDWSKLASSSKYAEQIAYDIASLQQDISLIKMSNNI